MRVQELGELAVEQIELSLLEERMRTILFSMVSLAKRMQFNNEFKEFHKHFDVFREAYCNVIGTSYKLTDKWDKARTKIITYWNYLQEGYIPRAELLDEALQIVEIKKAA